MMLDPLEKELDLPSVTVELCNRGCRDGEVIGQEVERRFRVRIVVLDSTQRLRLVLAALLAAQHHRLVATHPGRLVDRMRVPARVAHVGLGPDDEERPDGVQEEQTLEVHVPSVHDVERAGLGRQDVEDVHVVHLPVRDVNEHRDVGPQVQ